MILSAYIPCFNNRQTLAAAIASVRSQSVPIDELFVIDDGSSDESAKVAEELGARVFRQPANLGRGAARSVAMENANGEFVVCCDATNTLAPDFCARALEWFRDRKVAAVFGRMGQNPGGDAVTRWRGRYLFQIAANGTTPEPARHGSCLATYGAMVRRGMVMEVGNYDARLRHSEDAELGQRLLSRGWDVIQDPALNIISVVRNSLPQVLERYWRWNAGTEESISWSGYLKLLSYATKCMAARDLQEGDFGRALISLYCPHYQFWRSWWRRRQNRVQC